jgi:hypothetical protein
MTKQMDCVNINGITDDAFLAITDIFEKQVLKILNLIMKVYTMLPLNQCMTVEFWFSYWYEINNAINLQSNCQQQLILGKH